MNRRHAILLLSATFAPLTLRAQPGGGKRTIDVARDIFARAVAFSLNREPSSFRVLPVSDPSEIYSALQLGELYAWSAQAIDGKVFINGFSSAGESSASAFVGHVDFVGNQLGLAALLKAMRFNEPKRRLPLNQIMPRIAFCLNRPELGEILFDAKLMESSGFAAPDAVREPRIHAQKSGHMLSYFTMVPGLTGTWDIWKVSMAVLPNYSMIISREPVGY